MYNLNLAFEGELKKLIQEEIDRLKDNLSNGLSTPDFAAYKNQVGKIAGLTQALELCEEAKTIVNKKY
jgi:hypothetical protein